MHCFGLILQQAGIYLIIIILSWYAEELTFKEDFQNKIMLLKCPW